MTASRPVADCADADQQVEYVTAETKRGMHALEAVMAHSYTAAVSEVPPAWACARLAGGVPVSFILIDPDRQMAFSGGEVRYAFICDVATREDRRREGHFRAIMEHTFTCLREAGISLVLTHGRYPLYRRFGFDVFTHHCGIFLTPVQIERTFREQDAGDAERLLEVETHKALWDDLLLVTDVKARTLRECRLSLQAAASVARKQGKDRILFEHPAAPSYGSRYPIYPSLETPFMAMARTCGAQVRIEGADPEGSSVLDADWIKVLDAAKFVQSVLDVIDMPVRALPLGVICLDTDAGAVTIESTGGKVVVSVGSKPSVPTVKWPSSALAQLVTGYRSAGMLEEICGRTSLTPESLALLHALYPRQWRLSRNESWVFGS